MIGALQPFWIEVGPSEQSAAWRLGVGVTERSEADAQAVFHANFGHLASVASVRAVRDVAELDQRHVVPNMGCLLTRGVWFPLGHERPAG